MNGSRQGKLFAIFMVSLPLLIALSWVLDPWQWLASHYGYGADEWERILTRTWFLLTPPILNIATFIMGGLLIFRARWKVRMARASFGLVSGYALIMDRFLYLQWSQQEALPQPASLMLWTYVFTTGVYFAYALLLEWGIPFALVAYRQIRADIVAMKQRKGDSWWR